MEKRIICNCCGKEIKTERGIAMEDYLPIRKEWGYFSGKDGKRQECILCESCWNEITRHFKIPVSAAEITELI